jgi:hypothetical protein
MVRIPKFYFKAGTVPSGPYAGKAYWMISPTPASGFSVHPAFIGEGGVEMDEIWVGKYQASYDGSSKAQSLPGVMPMVSMDFPTARARAYARNTGGVSGFRLWSIYDLSAIQMLATIEMGGLDMQSLIGMGRVNASSAANVDASDVAQATWRGIVGLWGNVWQMTDGIKRNGGNWHRWQYNVPGNTTTNDFSTGYVDTGRPALSTSDYPVTFDTSLLANGIFVPASVDSSSNNGSTGDHFWSNNDTTDRVCDSGGMWGNNTTAGLFAFATTDAPSDAGGHIGTRLAKTGGSIPYSLLLGPYTLSGSGTSITVTGIPSWARAVVVSFRNMSWNGTTGDLRLRLGTSGGVENANYIGGLGLTGSSGVASASSATNGATLGNGWEAMSEMNGAFLIAQISGTTWSVTGKFHATFSGVQYLVSISCTSLLAGQLDRIQMLNIGSATFDNGILSVLCMR